MVTVAEEGRTGAMVCTGQTVARTRQRVADADVKATLAGVDVAEVRAPRDGAILRVFERASRHGRHAAP